MNTATGARVTIDVMHGRAHIVARLGIALLLLPVAVLGGCQQAEPDYRVIAYDAARYPHIECLAGRVIAETDPVLTERERAELWHRYGLRPSFEWIVEESGFTYHELEVVPHSLFSYARSLIAGERPAPRELVALIELLGDDPRVAWAAPDALVLHWAQPIELPPGEELIIDEPVEPVAEVEVSDALEEPPADMYADGLFAGPYGASFIDEYHRPLSGGLADWIARGMTPPPLPDFEYYRLCSPTGSAVPWAEVLIDSEPFMERCRMVYGINQARALNDYIAAGEPLLAPVTVCVADTGLQVNHPQLSGVLHPNSIDANYRSYEIAAAVDRPAADEEIVSRNSRRAVGLPRPVIKGRPAAHGTAVAGVVARCTAGFNTATGPVRILPVAVKSATTTAVTGVQVKSPISAFVKLVRCLSREYPTGTTDTADPVADNRGDVRVVTLSGSVPKSYFGDAEWRIVAPLVGKAAGSIAEDLRHNDRVYLFSAGNDAQGEPGRPGEMDYVLSVAAADPFDGSQAWEQEYSGEGSNLGMQCVSAPGSGIISSLITRGPNLAYLPATEFRPPVPSFSTPPRGNVWEYETNIFGATSAAAPQVAALAALLYAQDPDRDYPAVIALIGDSTGGREIAAHWGKARGLVDYAAALQW